MIKIAGGSYRSRVLEVPDTLAVPTKSIVRTAIGNALSNDLRGARVLDLFAGCGAVGIELLSRGASSCVFVDHSQDCIDAIKANLEKLRIGNATVMFSDYFGALGELYVHKDSFDIIFLDPPYAQKDVYKDIPALLIKKGLLKEKGILVLEYEGSIVDSSSLFKEGKVYNYGRTSVQILRR
jgi:16S rRNA (guanine966-N2)-methyltransferase